MTKIITPETFIDRLIKKNELSQPFALTDHQRVSWQPLEQGTGPAELYRRRD
jgi:hypothetical protein